MKMLPLFDFLGKPYEAVTEEFIKDLKKKSLFSVSEEVYAEIGKLFYVLVLEWAWKEDVFLHAVSDIISKGLPLSEDSMMGSRYEHSKNLQKIGV